MSARSKLTILSAALAAALTMTGGGPAAAQDLSEVAVSGRAPTQIAISLAGKSVAAVRSEVHVAARIVCRNAVDNHDLGFEDLRWCRQKSASRALHRYDAILAGARQTAALPAAIVLSSR